jgi:hypothetical protein
MGNEDCNSETVGLVGLRTGHTTGNEAGMLRSTDHMSDMGYWNVVTHFNRLVL